MEKTQNKKEKFKKIATKRVNSILKKLEILGNCSNRQYYDYSEKDVYKIFRTINSKVKETKALFKVKSDNDFKF